MLSGENFRGSPRVDNGTFIFLISFRPKMFLLIIAIEGARKTLLNNPHPLGNPWHGSRTRLLYKCSIPVGGWSEPGRGGGRSGVETIWLLELGEVPVDQTLDVWVQVE